MRSGHWCARRHLIVPDIGTAIRAGIGAAAGFVASGLEKLVGIESDAQKALDDLNAWSTRPGLGQLSETLHSSRV
jgi:hypothetical protein